MRPRLLVVLFPVIMLTALAWVSLAPSTFAQQPPGAQ